MLSHSAIWDAIDALAKRHGLSPSGLARLAGLDSTAFNKSKRISKDGRERWPSTESIAKILDATDERFSTFFPAGITNYQQTDAPSGLSTVPLLGFSQAKQDGFFDADGFPSGKGWDQVNLPDAGEKGTYALEVSGDNMLPLYRDGDILIVSVTEQIRRGDRVVVRQKNGNVIAKVLQRQTANSIELFPLAGNDDPLVLETQQISWVARILWASQ